MQLAKPKEQQAIRCPWSHKNRPSPFGIEFSMRLGQEYEREPPKKRRQTTEQVDNRSHDGVFLLAMRP